MFTFSVSYGSMKISSCKSYNPEHPDSDNNGVIDIHSSIANKAL